MISLSKGLGAPVGSLICGGKAFVQEARRVRKMLGGGMRQVGILAAAGLVALRQGPGGLAADHANAAYLAGELAAIPGLEIDPAMVETNILIFRITAEWFPAGVPPEGPAAAFLARAREAGVLGVPVSRDQVRLVTHKDVPWPRVEEAVERLRSCRSQVLPTRNTVTHRERRCAPSARSATEE